MKTASHSLVLLYVFVSLLSLDVSLAPHAMAFLGSSNNLPLGPTFSANPSSLVKIRCPLSQVSLTTPLSILFSYGLTLFLNNMVLGSTYPHVSDALSTHTPQIHVP